ncbi:MAG: hypothetical protein AAGF99_00940 [Bacteroidota bacterium]
MRLPLLALLLPAVAVLPAVAQTPAEAFSDLAVPDTTVAVGLDLPEEDWEGYLDGCSLLCAIGWTTTASSALAPQGANRYAVDEAEDGNPRSAWVEGVDGPGLGERLMITLGTPDDPDDFTTSFDGVRVINGYAKSMQTWEANGRVRHLEVHLNDRLVTVIVLHDTAMLQEATWANLPVRPGDRIDLVITGVYAGTRYEDTALSEVLLLGAH